MIEIEKITAENLTEIATEYFDSYRDVTPGMTFTTSEISAQVRKLMEEVGEFVETVMDRDPSHALEEAADVAWMMVDIMHVMRHANPDLSKAMKDCLVNKLFKRFPPKPSDNE